MLADQAAQEAKTNAELAQDNAALAEQRAVEAQGATTLAEARELAASAINVVESDPELATLLAIEAIDATAGDSQPVEVINALWRAGQHNRLVEVIEHGFGGKTHVTLSTEAGRLVVTSEEGAVVQMYDAESLQLLWEYSEDTVDSFTFLSVVPDGSRVAVGVIDSAGLGAVRDVPPGHADELANRVIVLDGATGALIKTLEFPECRSVEQNEWSPDGRFLVVGSGFEGCPRNGVQHWNEVYDAETWQPIAFLPAPSQGGPGVGSTLVHFDEGGRLFTLTAEGPAQTYAAETFEQTGTLAAVIGLGAVTADGSLIASDGPGGPINGPAIHDSATGEVRDLSAVDENVAVPLGTSFSDDGSLLIVGTKGRYTSVFDVRTGERLFHLPGGQVNNSEYDVTMQRLFTAHDDGTVKIWDLSFEVVGVATAGELAGPYVAQNRLHIGPERGAFISFDFETATPYVQFFDPTDGRLLDHTVDGWLAFPLADGRFVYESVEGPWAFYDPATGDTQPFLGCVIEPDGTCADTEGPAPYYFVMVSAESRELVAVPSSDGVTTDGTLIRLSVDDGAVIAQDEIPSGFVFARYIGDTWLMVGNSDQHFALDRLSGERLWAGKTPISTKMSPSQKLMVYPAEGTGLGIVDTTTWTETVIGDDFGNVRGISFSPDETKVALGNTDRLIIFDLVELTTAQVLEIPEVQSSYWIDDETIMIGTANGVWGQVSLSTDSFLAETRAHLRRSLTETECTTYGIDPCPSLEEIRSR